MRNGKLLAFGLQLKHGRVKGNQSTSTATVDQQGEFTMSKKIPHEMLVKSIGIAGALCVSSILWAMSAWAATSPLEMIRSTTKQALTALADAPAKGEDQRQDQIERMWQVILPSFDTQEIAQRSLGANWQKLTAEQQKEFVRLYVQLVKKSYSSTLARYTTDAQFFFDNERIEGDHAEVQTRIKTPSQDNPFSVIYRLHQHDGTWQIYDVVAENVSLVQNYRNQFSRIMAKSSPDELLDALKQKITEPEAQK